MYPDFPNYLLQLQEYSPFLPIFLSNEDGKAEVLVQGKVSGGQSEAYKVQIRNGEGEIILEANTEKPEKVFFIDNPRVWNGKSWFCKDAKTDPTDKHCDIFPIPKSIMDGNINLVQNPGY